MGLKVSFWSDFGKRLLSRKFLLSVLAAVVAFGNGFWDWGLDFNELVAIIMPLFGFVVVEGLNDSLRIKNGK